VTTPEELTSSATTPTRTGPGSTSGPSRRADVIPLREATRAWFEISLQTFGGPAGQIAVMQHKLVDEKRWIGQKRFLHALSYCTLLPGPEAQQLAIYVGCLKAMTHAGLTEVTFPVHSDVAPHLATRLRRTQVSEPCHFNAR